MCSTRFNFVLRETPGGSKITKESTTNRFAVHPALIIITIIIIIVRL